MGRPISVREIGSRLGDGGECDPYILPLFPSTTSPTPQQGMPKFAKTTSMMGQNITWLCKALGSKGELAKFVCNFLTSKSTLQV